MDIDTSLIVAVVAVLGCVGGVIARDRYIAGTITNGDKAVRDEFDRKIAAMKADCDKDANVLHERINKTRDEFVRRDDLDGHLARIEKSISGMHEEQKGTNKRIDEFMTAMASNNGHSIKRQ